VAVFNGVIITNPTVSFGGKKPPVSNGTILAATAIVTYQYRILATGATGTTTSASGVPAGAVVTGIVTS